MRSSLLLISILLLAAVLRLWGLGAESLWLDEGLTAERMHVGISELVHSFHGQTQNVLYYLGERAWCAGFGRSEAALRFPSAVLGVLTVWAVFLLARQLFSQSAALWAAALLAVNPFAIFYSQEARPYALLLLAAVLSLYFFLRFLRSGGKPAVWGYLISASVALYTHPLGPLLLLVHGTMIFLFRDPSARFRPWPGLKMLAAVVVIYLPQLVFMWLAVVTKTHGAGPASWIPLPKWTVFAETLRQYFMTPYLAGFALLMLVVALVIFLRKGRPDSRGLFLCLVLGFVFVPLLWTLSYVLTPLYFHRFTIPALIAVLLILAWGLAALNLRWRIAALFVYLLLTAHGLFAYYTETDKDPWRRTAAVVREQTLSGSVIVLDAPYTRAAFEYYYSPLPNEIIIAPRSLEEIPVALDTARFVLIVRAYTTSKRDVTDSLCARAARGRVTNPTVRVNDLESQNPWSYWIADISVTRYVRQP